MAYTYHESHVRLPLIALPLLLLVSSVSAQAPTPPDCSASGPVRYVCGLAGPEDLAVVPQTKWLIASAMSGAGGLYLIDTTQATASRIFPAAGAERFDRKEYGACPGPLRPRRDLGNSPQAWPALSSPLYRYRRP
jgi:hypothetical protein